MPHAHQPDTAGIPFGEVELNGRFSCAAVENEGAGVVHLQAFKGTSGNGDILYRINGSFMIGSDKINLLRATAAILNPKMIFSYLRFLAGYGTNSIFMRKGYYKRAYGIGQFCYARLGGD